MDVLSESPQSPLALFPPKREIELLPTRSRERVQPTTTPTIPGAVIQR